jgi:hypothetical protein
MSFKSPHCRQMAYVVFALGRNRVDELVLVEEVLAACLVLLGVFHECSASKLRQLRLLAGAQQHLANLLRDRRHGESLCPGGRASIGLEAGRETDLRMEKDVGRGELVNRFRRRPASLNSGASTKIVASRGEMWAEP